MYTKRSERMNSGIIYGYPGQENPTLKIRFDQVEFCQGHSKNIYKRATIFFIRIRTFGE